MQWSAAPNAGFTEGVPWLPLAEDYAAVNVAAQRTDPGSMLCLYRALIELRRREPALALGSYAPLSADGSILAYSRSRGERQFLIALNLGSEPARLQLPAEAGGYELALSTLLDGGRPPQGRVLELRGDEGVILRAT